jgi:tellurite resistance protein TehA-like permease
LKANEVNLFVSCVLFVFWYHSLNFFDTPRILIGYVYLLLLLCMQYVVYVRLEVQADAHCMYSLFLYIFALHVSGAICTHPQEHKLQSTAIAVCNVYGMLIHCSRD